MFSHVAKDAARIAKKTVKVAVKKLAKVDNVQTDKMEVNRGRRSEREPPSRYTTWPRRARLPTASSLGGGAR